MRRKLFCRCILNPIFRHQGRPPRPFVHLSYAKIAVPRTFFQTVVGAIVALRPLPSADGSPPELHDSRLCIRMQFPLHPDAIGVSSAVVPPP